MPKAARAAPPHEVPMASVRDRLSQYQAAAAATATFGDADAGTDGGEPSDKAPVYRVQPPDDEQNGKAPLTVAAASRKEWNNRSEAKSALTSATPSPARSNTPLIIRKARDYEQKVKDLRADQDNPGANQKDSTTPTRTELRERARTRTRKGAGARPQLSAEKEKASSVPNRSNTPLIVRKARDYEETVKALRADQDTPGIMAKMKKGSAGDVTHIEEEPIEVPSMRTNSNSPSVQLPQRRNTPLVIRKARDSEQVKILRADQENPGTMARLESVRSGETNFDVDVNHQVESEDEKADMLQDSSTANSRRTQSELDGGTFRSNTPLIIRKARDYEQQVLDLRVDQEKPGMLEKMKSMKSNEGIVEDDDDDDETGNSSSPDANSVGDGISTTIMTLRSNTPLILRRARDYEQSVKDLLADQEKPGLMQKLKSLRERGDYAQHDEALQELTKVPTRRIAQVATTPTPISVNIEKVQNASLVQATVKNDVSSGIDLRTSVDGSSNKASLNDLDNLLNGHISDDEIPSSGSLLDLEDEPVSITANLVSPEDLPMSAPKLDAFIGTGPATGGSKSAHFHVGTQHTSNASSEETGSSFHSAPNLLQTDGALSLPSSEWSDDFDSLTSEESEGIVLMEELLLGQEFTNDAVIVAEEEELPPGEYLDAARRGEFDSSTSSSSSGHAKTISEESLGNARAPDRTRHGGGSNRPGRRGGAGAGAGAGAAPVSSPLPLRHSDTGIPSPVSLTVDLEIEEDTGVRNGWRREQSDRLPKAKVVIARRKSGELGRTMSASAAATVEGRQLVKQYKDRAELLEGRISRVDVRASRLTAAQREERARRHAAGVARRSSLVSGAIDRVSMAADPFIDFMADKGGVMPGPRKPRGKLGKILRRLFKGKKRDRELIKQA